MATQRTYLAIDLKSFYASVECVDRHLDPLTTNLVVADASRTEKTICLAVSPSLKAYKIPGRARLFEAVQRVREVNAQRLQTAIRQKKAVRGEDGKYHFATTSSGALEGLGKGTQSLVISLCRYIVFIMPLAWVLCRQFGPVGVWNAFWATEVLSAIVSLIVYKKSV